MITIDADVQWNYALEADLVVGIPAEAHLAASQATAQAVAAGAPRATGRLRADLSSPKPLSPLESTIGSDLVYAGIQEHGGTITPNQSPRLLVHAGPGGSGPVVASAASVTIRGTHYMDEASAYLALMTSALSVRMPHAV